MQLDFLTLISFIVLMWLNYLFFDIVTQENFVLNNLIMNAVQLKKQAFLKEAGYFFKNASVHADEGDLQSCAGLILKALDKERRASGVGPQVLHLIKTR